MEKIIARLNIAHFRAKLTAEQDEKTRQTLFRLLAQEEAKLTIIASAPSVAIVRPNCSRCGTRMSLVRIFPDKPGYDQRTYECPRCEYEMTEVVQVKKAV